MTEYWVEAYVEGAEILVFTKITKDALGLSAEYNNDPRDEKLIRTSEGVFRFVEDANDFRGFGFARPNLIADPASVRIREINQSIGQFQSPRSCFFI